MSRLATPVDDTAVEVDQWFTVFAFPSGETLSGFLVVLADDMIADRIQAVCIGGDCLVGFGRRYAPEFFAAPPLWCGG